MQASNYRRESLHSIMFSLEPCDWQMWFKNSYWWNLPLHCGIWTQRTKCSILSYTISWWTEVLFDHIPLLSNPLKHKINRICQNDYCITPLTHFNSRTEDNKIMDSSVLCAQSMGWFGFFFCSSHRAEMQPHSETLYSYCWMWMMMQRNEKGQFTAGEAKMEIFSPVRAQ